MRLAPLVVVALVASGCTFMGQDRTVDGRSVEKAIRASIVEQGGQVASIHCPDGKSAKKGVTFDCTLVVDGVNKIAHVTLTNDGPDFDYRLAKA
jgi:hypothetical protein